MTSKLSGRSVESLVKSFLRLGMTYPPLYYEEDAYKFEQHGKKMAKFAWTLRDAGPEGQSALVRLMDHEHVPIRLNAARASITFARDRAVAVLSDIMEAKSGPFSAQAGFSLMLAGEFDLETGLKSRPKPFPPEWEWKPKGPSRD